MLIVHVYDHLHPHSGGPPQVILHLARAQMNRGAHIRLISCDAGDPEVASLIRADLGREVELIELKPRGLRPLFSKPKIDRALEGATAVHLHSIWPTPNLFVALRCLQRRIPYILSVHGHLRREALAIKSLKKHLGLTLGYRSMLRGARAIHALTTSEAQEVRSFGLSAPCEVIPNGVVAPAHDEVKPPRCTLNEAIPKLSDSPYLLFLSRIHPPKGALLLAQAFCMLSAEYPSLHLVVAGPDFGGVTEVVSTVAQAGLADRLHLPGFLSGRVKHAALCHAEAFCLPSHHEGFSVAVLEALAWGAPTVISNACHFPELAENSVGWVHDLNVDHLLMTLREVLGDREAAQARAQAGARWVSEHFQWTRISERFDLLYETAKRDDRAEGYGAEESKVSVAGTERMRDG